MAVQSEIDDLLRGYVPPSIAQTTKWWETAQVAIDANVLLNLYRYSADTREQLLMVLRALGDRLWIPRQAAEEFARNRLAVLIRQRGAQEKIAGLFDRLIKDTERSLHDISAELSRRRGAPTHHERAVKALKALRDELLAEEQRRFGDASDLVKDPLLNDIKKLLKERVGDRLSDEQLDTIRRSGQERHRQGIPPGFEDTDKQDPYGDLLIWHEIIERSRTERHPVIFVTDDVKKDWLQRVGGKTIGPHPLLVRELWEQAKVPLLIYDTARFVDHANRELELGAPVSDEALEEVRDSRRLWTEWLTARPRWAFDPAALRPIQARGLYLGTDADQPLRDLRPRATATVTGETATLTLSDPPAHAELVCAVTESGGATYQLKRGSTADAAPVTCVYPHDFAGVTAKSGGHVVGWYEFPIPASIPRLLAHTQFAL